MEETIKALCKHEMRLRRLEAGLLERHWPTSYLRKKARILTEEIRETILLIVALEASLERIGKEE